MKRSIIELRKLFKRKISLMEKLLSMASKEDVLSDARQELLVQIAVELRAMFCNSGGPALIRSAELSRTMIFPFHNPLTAFNELRQFLLVECQIKDKKSTFVKSIDLRDMIAVTWLSYESWINEIVIDIKKEGYPPLTRHEVIKLLADKEGAHVDVNVAPFVELIESEDVKPLSFFIDGEECEGDCHNLLSETVFSIAEEVVYSYRHVCFPILREREPDNDFVVGVFDFSDEKIKRYKYTVCSPKINLYNTNKAFDCKISSRKPAYYDLLFKNRVFKVNVIRVEEE